MPIIKSAQKRMRQDQKRYAKNLRVKRELRDALKAFKAKPSFDGMKDVQSKIDTAIKKNVLKKNTGARRMAAISRFAKEAGVKIPAKKAAAKPVAKKPAVKKTTVAKKTTVKK
jgi:ribosomal protein S20